MSEQVPKEHTLYLIDVSSFIFRAYYAINRNLKNRKGEPTNATYGVATMLLKLLEQARPQYLAVVYDSKEPSFRKEIYSEYKANRSSPPEDLIPQFDRITELVKTLNLYSYRQSGVEADDLIGTLTQRWLKMSKDNHVLLLTGDKDLMQLVGDRVQVWDTLKDKVFGSDEVFEKFAVWPTQIRDYLSLVGDSSDNIPGVPSIGPKTASDLIKEFGSLKFILDAAEAGKITGKKGEVIKSNKKAALLSYELVGLKMDLRLDLDLDSLRYRFQVSEECLKLFRELDFNTLAEKYRDKCGDKCGKDKGAEKEPTQTSFEIPRSPTNFSPIQSEKDLEALLGKIDKKGEFGFDLETTSLNPRSAKLVGLSVCVGVEQSFYIPVGHTSTEKQLPKEFVLEKLKPFLENPKFKKIGQNLKYDWSVLCEQGIRPDGIGADTMVASYVLDPEGRHNLGVLAAKYLGYDILTYEKVCGKGKDEISFDQVPIELATRYSAEDAWVAFRLWECLKPKLYQEGLMQVFAEVELPLVAVLAKIELQGVCIDEGWLGKLSQEFEKELKQIEERTLAFTKEPLNLNSPKQLAKFLFEDLKLPVQTKTKTGYSTDASVLEALSPLHEVPRLLLEYREISKLKGTYVDPLPLLKDKKTGKIHASFHQTVAATGRLSSSDPNLQNIPVRTERGKKIRRAFIPSPGNVLLSVDYSQIELRILAHMSGDKNLSQSFERDEDVHLRTASEIFGISPEKISDEQRGVAKAVNFGLMYGKTAFGLSQELKIPRVAAKQIITRYFERYSGVKTFLDSLIVEAREKGFTTTLTGRKRRLPDLHSKNPMIRANAERMAMNTPIQGTAADLMKLAMITLDHELEKRGLASRMIIQVHDELVLDVSKEEIQEVKKCVITAMEGAMDFDVPLKVNVSSGLNWMEL